MEIFLAIAAILLAVIGAAGCIVPILPGVVLSFGGLLCAFAREESTLSSTLIWIWLVIVAIVSVLDYFLPAYMTKIFGGSRPATIGATIGAICGFFLGPLGIIAGPFFGAVIGELKSHRNDLNRAIKVGLGSFLSFIVGTGVKLMAASGMLIYICRDIFFN